MSITIEGKKYYGIIYKIENIITGKVYIGQTTHRRGFNGRYDYKGIGIERVYNYSLNKASRGVDYNQHLLCSMKKYGLDAFVVDEVFDTVMIYNAFPHFINPRELFANLSAHLKTSGRLSVAHGLSEKELAECHSGSAKNVSQSLMSKENLAEIMSEFFDVDVMISDDKMYMVSGVKR